MKRVGITGLVILTWICVMLVGAYAETTQARILLGKRELVCSPAAVYDGKRVLAPLSILESLGAVCTISANGKQVTVTSASGHAGAIALVDVGDAKMLPVDEVIGVVGGETAWDAGNHTLTLTAHVRSVEFVDGTLKVNCSFPTICETRKWTDKLIVDVADAKVATEAREVYVGGPIVARARLGQYSPTTARVVLDLMQDADIALQSRLPAAQLAFAIGQNLPKPDVQTPRQGETPADQKPKPKTKPPASQPYTVNAIALEPIDGDSFRLVIQTSAKALIARSFGVMPPEVALELIGALLGESAGQFDGAHPLLKSFKIRQAAGGKRSVRIAMALNRVVAYDTTVTDNAVTLTIRLPDKAGGSLAEKTVVIDPGHGGREGGARWESINEKDINVRLANELVAALAKEGANTILTRTTDEVLVLKERPRIAIDRGADLFVSLHCNSNGSPGSESGIETYYHMDEPSPMALAYLVQAAVCSATGMCDNRARSDRELFVPGLAVLRGLTGSGIPGVLVECGYLNTASDRKRLLSAEYRKKLAAGIVAGLKAYVEGEPIK